MTFSPAASPTFLRGLWYVAADSKHVARGKMVHRTLLGQPVLIGRDTSGAVFALADTCPHRGTLLSRGAFDGAEVECPYHGWRFGTDGQCTAIPSQMDGQKPQAKDIRAQTYSVRESQGVIWLFLGTTSGAEIEIPQVPFAAEPQLFLTRRFHCDIDLAVTGLMDPAHGAWVHASALWRGRRDVREKQKSFSPVPLGWRMDRHTASGNARAYRLFLGGAPETEITYTLPGIRIEHATTGKYTYCGLTACTPVDASTTDVHHVMYWDVPGGALTRFLVRLAAQRFLGQDADAVQDMRDGQAFGPKTILVQDADTQIRWYYRLKEAWKTAQDTNAAFANPIERVDLRWRS